MTDGENIDYSEQTLALLEKFAGMLPGRLDRIEELWEKLVSNWGDKALQELIYQIHLLSGSASTFGYPEVGRIALLHRVDLEAILLEP